MDKKDKLKLKTLSDSRLSRTRSNLIEARDLDDDSLRDEFSDSSDKKAVESRALEENLEKKLSKTRSLLSSQSTSSRSSKKNFRSLSSKKRTKKEILGENQFLSNYNVEKELEIITDLLLSKVRINPLKMYQSNANYLKQFGENSNQLTSMNESDFFSWELCKLNQFYEMNKLRKNIIKSVFEVRNILSTLPSKPTIVEDLDIDSFNK